MDDQPVDFYPTNVPVHKDKIDSCINHIRFKMLEPATNSFSENVEQIARLLALPFILLVEGTTKAEWLVYFVRALVSTRKASEYEQSDSARKAVMDETHRLWTESHEESWPRMVQEAKTHLRRLLEMDEIRSSIRSLLLAVTSSTWTAFEILATDMWVVALNERPMPLGQRVFEAVPPGAAEEGLDSKQVSVKVLSKYGFDLRNKLGDLLKGKFDFTSVSGIHKAYACALGRSNELDEIMNLTDVRLLEAMRHLIVHRGAIVDEEFIRRTHLPMTVGEALPLDGETVYRIVNSTIDAGCRLIMLADNSLTNIPTSTPTTG